MTWEAKWPETLALDSAVEPGTLDLFPEKGRPPDSQPQYERAIN